MAFADIVKYQKSQGKGVLGSLSAATLQTTLSKIDPRNRLFDRSGTMTALFPGLKGYQPKTSSDKVKTGSTLSTSVESQQNSLIAERLDVIGKNTMTLPVMMRDMNVMRQSLVKLVRLSGGTQRDKADRFFLNAKTREDAYESKFVKTKATSPTQVKSTTDGGGNILSDIVGTLLKGIAVGGLITLVGKALENPEVRGAIEGILKSLFKAIGEILSIKLTSFETPFGELNVTLGGAIAAVVGSLAAFNAAIIGASAALTRMALGGIGSKAGLPLGAAALAAAPLAVMYAGKEWAENATIKDSSGNLSTTGQLLDTASKTVGGSGVRSQSEMSSLERLESDTKVGWWDFGGKKRRITKIQSDIDRGATYTPEEAVIIKKNLDFTVPEQNIKTQQITTSPPPPPAQQSKSTQTQPQRVVKSESEIKRLENALTNLSMTHPDRPGLEKQLAAAKQGSVKPTQVQAGDGQTFNQMSKAEQDSLLMNQAIAEGWNKPTSIQHSHNNPGNIVAPGGKVTAAQAKFGGVPGGTYNGLTFVKFPTMQAGWDAMRDLWSRKYGNQPVSQALATWSNAGKDQGSYNQVALGGALSGWAIQTGSSSGGSTSLASSQPQNVPYMKSSASAIAGLSSDLEASKRDWATNPIIINSPSGKAPAPQQPQQTPQYTAPSVADSEFVKLLVGRAVA